MQYGMIAQHISLFLRFQLSLIRNRQLNDCYLKGATSLMLISDLSMADNEQGYIFIQV